jgi:RimJ/RimL family protein N-acetyltransferase
LTAKQRRVWFYHDARGNGTSEMIDLKDGVRIRKIDEKDIEDNWDSLLFLRNDVATALQILSRPLGQNRDDIRNWIRSRNAQSGCIFLGIFLDDALGGYVMFTEECRISGVGEVSITLIQGVRKRGVGSIALSAFVDYLYGALDYRKFTARILDSNSGSIKVFEKNDFCLVGTMKSHRKIQGRYHDVRLYEKIIDEAS